MAYETFEYGWYYLPSEHNSTHHFSTSPPYLCTAMGDLTGLIHRTSTGTLAGSPTDGFPHVDLFGVGHC